MSSLLIVGGSGFLGRRIADVAVSRGHSVTVVSRGRPTMPGCNVIGYDGLEKAVASVDVVINLAGENVGARRWSARVRHAILSSRVDTTRRIAEAIRSAPSKPALVNASAVGYYGDTYVPSNEAMGAGQTFLADVTRRWEEAAMSVSDVTRVVCLRVGVVLDPSEGALAKLLLPMRLFVGGVLGNGRQMLAWVHRDDVVEAFLWAATDVSAYGPYNVVAPEAASMRQFTKALGACIGRPAILPVPSGVLRLALGKQADVVLHSQYAVPMRLLGTSFRFQYPDLKGALHNLLRT
ncbi:MAG: TIGR01777 family protein [Candidatus Kapabacteria bacterium]|nr:TIGR01777 family protein [Candidatus Kapabacteria bacterium]